MDPKAKEERERAVNEKLQAQYEKGQKRLAEVVSFNSCKQPVFPSSGNSYDSWQLAETE